MIRSRRILASGLIAAALTLGLAMPAETPARAQSLENQQSEFVDNLPPQIWVATVEETPRGHRIGNPDAEVQLIEFISYTCSGCAQFSKQSDGTLDLAAVGPGFIAIEVRPVIRNWLDVVVTLLAQCGGTERFKDSHRMFLYSQDQWLKKAVEAPKAQQAIWARGDARGRLNAAQALDLDDLLINRGLTAPQVNACLADNAKADAIRANDKADRSEFAIPYTPAFAINGESLLEVHSWPALAADLQARFAPGPNASNADNNM